MRYHEIISEGAAPFRQVVSNLTTDTAGGNLPLPDLRALAKQHLLAMRGQNFRNKDTGLDIVVTMRAVNKSVNVGSILLRLLFALKDILEQGVFISTEPPRDYRPKLQEMLTLGATVQLNDEPYHVVAKVHRYPGVNQHYSLHFDGDIQAIPVA